MIIAPSLRAEIVVKRIQTTEGLLAIGVDTNLVGKLVKHITNFITLHLK